LAVVDTVTGLNQPSGVGGQMIQPGPPCVEAAAKCHRARQTASFARRTVTLADAFDTKTSNVNAPDALCYALEDGGRETRRLCYRVSDARGQTARAASEVSLTDAFGSVTVIVTKPLELCTPVEGSGGPVKCYKAKLKGGTHFAPRTAGVTD